MNNIRNFAIISHIDHGKSTLADRLLEITKTIPPREMRNRFLDNMELEREKGITIKLKAVRMHYQGFVLNLIDTPGHTDFSYEVSRALVACEGALLLIDASQGIQAQTLAVLRKAKKQKLTIIPVLNKMDLAVARENQEKLEQETRLLLDGYQGDLFKISAKTGAGVKDLLEAIIKQIPPPRKMGDASLKALIFDSFYSPYQGVIAQVRVFAGQINKGDKLTTIATKANFTPLELGWLGGDLEKTDSLREGEVGFIATGLKDLSKARVGDTITQEAETLPAPLPGYQTPQAMVFLSFYPRDARQFGELQKALQKLQLTDSALQIAFEQSPALGAGFRVGFLGLLHAEIIAERLKREYQLDLVSATPRVAYQFRDDGIYEPLARLEVFTPSEYQGAVIKLINQARGLLLEKKYLGEQSLRIVAQAPLSEIVTHFHHRLKAGTAGYASFNYEFTHYEKGDLAKMDILVHHEKIPSLSRVVPRRQAEKIGRDLLLKLKQALPRQQFKVALQATLEGKIIARETLPAYRKDVTAKLYGGDRTRRDKLLKKQAKGKKRMRQRGKIALSPVLALKLVS